MTGGARRALALLLLLGLLAGPAAAQAPAPARPAPADPFAPLNLLLTAERLAAIEAAVARGDPLAVAARDQALAEAEALLGRAPDPLHGDLAVPGFYTARREEQRAITRRLRDDAAAADALAMAFALTGEARFADRAEAFLDAWVAALVRPVDGGAWWQAPVLEHRGDTPLVIAYAFPRLLQAHDVLRGLGRVDAAERARFVAWLRPFVDYCRPEEPYANNHHDWQVLFLMTAAHVTEDRPLFDLAVRRLRRAFGAKLCPDGALGRELLRGEKAATYTLMALEALLQAVLVGERHGYAGLRDLRAGRATERVKTFETRWTGNY